MEYVKEWLPMLERKLLVNLCINPLTAVLGVNNGELLHNPYYFSLFKTVYQEGSAVLGMTNNAEVWEDVKQVCKQTEANRSSMLNDLVQGMQTEVEAICGYVLKRAGGEHRLPTVRLLYELIKGKEFETRGRAAH